MPRFNQVIQAHGFKSQKFYKAKNEKNHQSPTPPFSTLIPAPRRPPSSPLNVLAVSSRFRLGETPNCEEDELGRWSRPSSRRPRPPHPLRMLMAQRRGINSAALALWAWHAPLRRSACLCAASFLSRFSAWS